jgi:hypothetical protein
MSESIQLSHFAEPAKEPSEEKAAPAPLAPEDYYFEN